MAKKNIPCIKVRQWVDSWNEIQFEAPLKTRPQEDFYIFSISAKLLSKLSTVDARETAWRAAGGSDFGSQRILEESRAKKIWNYIKYGYPSSDLTETQRGEARYDTLRNPGWLPTSIVVNIKPNTPGITLIDDGDFLELFTEVDQIDQGNLPIEIIDWQHRLAAFNYSDTPDMDLPVVAFFDLSKSWQAYLFWTINIKPKKINPSLAFDLYPLLRNMDWLNEGDDLKTFRQTRAQEIVETLFLNPASPWKNKINMLWWPWMSHPTQAWWMRALERSYLGPKNGVFSNWQESHEMFQWNRETQKLFLIYLWKSFHTAVAKDWSEDDTFYTKNKLIATEQGIVAFMSVTNSIFKMNKAISFWNISLNDWDLSDLSEEQIKRFWDDTDGGKMVHELTSILSKFNWWIADTFTAEEDKNIRLAFRGSSGYVLFRKYLLRHIRDTATETPALSRAASDILDIDNAN